MNTIKFSFQTRWGADLFETMLFFGHYFACEIGIEEKNDLTSHKWYVVSADIPDFSHYRDIEDLATWIHDHELEYDPMGEGK